MHQYVCVHGSLKMFGSQRYINATNVRKATPYQFYHWLLETMVIKLTLERGPVRAHSIPLSPFFP